MPKQKDIKGNKGEWSEFYTFLKLLSDKRLVAADADLKKIKDVFYPVLKIVRQQASGTIEYEFAAKGKVRILQSNSEIVLVSTSDLKRKIKDIFTLIKSRSDTTFTIPVAEELMSRFKATRLNAGNSRKEDLTLKIHDRNTGTEPEVGFSIKSMLGSPASLLNASTATNFIYKISGIDENKVTEINAIEGKSKIRNRLTAIIKHGGIFSYRGISSNIFEKNLRKIDTVLPEIASELILAYYSNEGSKLPKLVSKLGTTDIKILAFDLDTSDYEFKIKSLLHNIALGMVPNSPWDGLLRAHGGYIIVRDDGEIVCYHVYNADDFRNYLFNHTKFDTPSTSRHEFGTIYKQGKDLLIKLNIQIRFIR